MDGSRGPGRAPRLSPLLALRTLRAAVVGTPVAHLRLGRSGRRERQHSTGDRV